MRLAALILVLAGLANGQTILQSFDGNTGTVSSPGVPTQADHPDMAMASNGYQIITADRQNVNVYSYGGQLISTQTTANFITASGVTAGSMRDPRVVYDKYIDRFLFVCSCSTDFLIVSGSSNAIGTWKGVTLGMSIAGDLTMRVGFNRQGVYISEDNASATTTYIVGAIPSADVAWTGSGTVSLTHLNTFTNQNFELFPAFDLYDDGTHTEYFVARNGPTQTGNQTPLGLLLNALTWVGNTATLGGTVTINTAYQYNTPVDMAQTSTPTIRGAESHRIYQPEMAADGTLHLVTSTGPCASSCGTQGVDTNQIILWFVVDPVGDTIVQSAKISNASLAYLFPTSALDVLGNDYICATSGGSAQLASIDCWTHKSTDAAGVINGPTRVITGTQVYAVCATNNPVGWGTYSQTAYDPLNPNSVWTLQEYGASATACFWQEHLAQLQITAPAVNASPAASLLTQNEVPTSSPVKLTEEDSSLWRF